MRWRRHTRHASPIASVAPLRPPSSCSASARQWPRPCPGPFPHCQSPACSARCLDRPGRQGRPRPLPDAETTRHACGVVVVARPLRPRPLAVRSARALDAWASFLGRSEKPEAPCLEARSLKPPWTWSEGMNVFVFLQFSSNCEL